VGRALGRAPRAEEIDMTSLYLPRSIQLGGGALAALPNALAQFGLSRPLIITDHFLVQNGMLSTLTDVLAAHAIDGVIFADTVQDPTVGVVDAALDVLAKGNFDCVVGFGGGSPIDTAKVVAALGLERRSVATLKAPNVTDVAGLPIVAIPTTAGTGSEATQVAIITDEISNEKMLCIGLAFLPMIAIVDYHLTLSKPKRLTADTAIDSLTHAIEAYVSKRANPFSDAMALSAMRLIAANIRQACAVPNDHDARAAMMIGAHHGGIAFSNASVALVHGMSRPIGALFHVPHGLSNAMLLPLVTAFSAPSALTRYADCARAMGVATLDEDDQVSVAHLLDALKRLNDDLEVPTPAEYGISPRDWAAAIPIMAQQALASGSPAHNPRSASAQEIETLYRQAYSNG
jgi:alcohol dehydrogenase class IV